MNMTQIRFVPALIAASMTLSSATAAAADKERSSNNAGADQCAAVPNHTALKQALTDAQLAGNGGLGNQMWGTVVNRDGVVCAVAFTGDNRGSQWPGSRVISAQKAYTANAFSLPRFALSTANLYTAAQPGGTLFGLQHSNPVEAESAYRGPATDFGTDHDPMVGHRVGGVNVFGGGLALYDITGQLVGAVGVSGDTSCTDHNTAWRTRNNLGLDHVPAGVSDAQHPDNIIYDIAPLSGPPFLEGQRGLSAGGFGHPTCAPAPTPAAPADLPRIPTK